MARKAGTAKDATGGGEAARGYTVLARRYRSRDFAELVGQEPIARTLQRSIEAGRTAHAYLFCGTRGVGKTSMARIFAAALNAPPEGEGDAEVSGQVADSVLRGEDLDVIEIDGASNRGINEARDLIAGASLAPVRGPYKVYIIDEVHMLTREAFNALLKTMEEPPSHVKFILCTTDPQKVPATIQSRCQRFDFRAIPTKRIAEHLRDVLEREGVEAEEDLVLAVAGLGHGSMRDALSLLDRLLAAGDRTLTLQHARDVLGLPDHGVVDRAIDAIVAGDPAAGLAAGAELIAGGATVESALEQLAERLRSLMVIAACGADTELVDLTEEDRAACAERAAAFDVPGLVCMIAVCDAASRAARGSATGRALFDAALVRLCLAERLADVPALLAGAGADGGAADEKKKPRGVERPRVSAAPTGVRPEPVARRPEPPSRPATPRPSSAPAPAPTPTPTAAPGAAPLTLDALWSGARTAAAGAARLETLLEAFEPRALEGDRLRVSPREDGASASYLRARAERLGDLLRTAAGRRIEVEVEVDESRAARPALAEDDPRRQALEGDPLVREAVDLFDAVVTSVRPAESGDA